MALDYQAIGVAATAIAAAAGAIFTGLQTGKSARTKDRQTYNAQMEQFRIDREAAEEIASRSRVEAIAADAAFVRQRLRETEDQHRIATARFYEELRLCQNDRQRGWDLARYYFGLTTTLVHIFNNVFNAAELAGEDVIRVINVLRNASDRIKDLRIPENLEGSGDKKNG